jgi:type IV pilus assembly protein PilM
MALFPVPAYLSMPAVGLDISEDAVRFIELVPHRGYFRVSRYANKNFSSGVVRDGRLADKNKLRETIAQLAHEYKLSFANIALPEEQAYLVNMRLPRAAIADIRGAVEIHLEEYAPISGSAAYFDFMRVEDPKRQHDSIDVVVSALPMDAVNEYLTIFRDTGIIPKAFEFESQAMARSIIRRGDTGTYMIIDIGKMVSEICVKARGVVQFSASLDVGGETLTQAIMRSLKITAEEAEALKFEHGLLGGSRAKEVHEALVPAVMDLRSRLLRHYGYWQTHHGEKFGDSIEHIYLSGGGANMKGLPEFIAQSVDVGVSVANPWVNVAPADEYIPPLLASESLGYTAAIGLALRSLHRI